MRKAKRQLLKLGATSIRPKAGGGADPKPRVETRPPEAGESLAALLFSTLHLLWLRLCRAKPLH